MVFLFYGKIWFKTGLFEGDFVQDSKRLEGIQPVAISYLRVILRTSDRFPKNYENFDPASSYFSSQEFSVKVIHCRQI